MKKHILLVDDEPIVINTLKSGLKRLGYEVSSYNDPQVALDNYQNDKPDIIVVDYSMPAMNGLEMSQKIMALKHCPIIMLSAYNELPLVKEAIGVGVSGYLVKPIEAERLVPTIEATLARFAELNALIAQGENIQAGVESHRLISTAVGIVMSKKNYTQDLAFESLRKYSRDQRRPLKDIAFDLVDAVSTENTILSDISACENKL